MEADSRKPQFDAALGGSVRIPEVLDIGYFVKARINEVAALTKLIETPSNNILQRMKFPKHLRRRAMSHNVKRLPTRLREEHLEKREKSGTTDAMPRRPRRKYRRRPSNLLSEYNRRQRQYVWLETHIWHAKRFHMTQRWGYSLPLRPNDKSYRACYRATTTHCLIQDISYYCCIELCGQIEELINGLNMHCSQKVGLTFNSSWIQSGSYEGTIFFYKACTYPEGAIGEVKYFWRPSNSANNTPRTLWLWCHPSFHNDIIEELIQTFSLRIIEPMEIDVATEEKNVETIKLETRNVPFLKTPKYNSTENSVQMILLKDTLTRFRLTGPLSQALITQAFRPVDLEKRTVQDWTHSYLKEEGAEVNKLKVEFWEKMKAFTSPGQLPRNMIFSMVVTDPRFTLPTGRHKVGDAIKGVDVELLASPRRELCESPLWSPAIRDEVTRSKLSTHQLNEVRSHKLVPGFEVESKETNFYDLPAIPLHFIQDPGEDNGLVSLGYGSSWDIIAPAGYGMPVWLALHLHGGRAGGLKELSNLSRERCRLIFPPDTPSGKEYELSLEKEDEKTFFGLPPAKRQNYIKLGVPFPFSCPWKVLIRDWTGFEDFHVLRDKNKLTQLKNKLKNPSTEFSLEEKDYISLVPVLVKLKDKGTLVRNSYICIPHTEDLEKFKEGNFAGPVEPQHKDENEIKRSEQRTEHQKLLKRLARKRQKNKTKNIVSNEYTSTKAVNEHKQIMKDLWLPGSKSVKNFCSRTTIGYVREADFSLAMAKTVGLGYVVIKGLLEFVQVLAKIEKCDSLVLVRNINSNQYRFAKCDILTS